MVARTSHKPEIGLGIYGIPEAARYARLHPARVRSWFRSRADRLTGSMLSSDFTPVGGRYSVSFLDLVDVRIAGELRSRGVTMPVIRRAYETLRDRLDTDHPFSHSDILTDGQSIFVHTANDLGSEDLREAISDQHFFPRVRKFLAQIDYHAGTRLARRWRVSRGVVIDPQIGLGKPTVENTGVATFVLANAFRANDRDAGLVADLFGVSVADVENAVGFEDAHHRGKAAA